MSKPRNPGYQGGNNWGICDRCGQAYRQTELVNQRDGLRVCVHDCYDKRHPQEAVRDKGWECGGDGAQGTGLDWNGAGRLARPDVDPLSFIREPNDAYFTTIPTSTFGIGSLSYCVPPNNDFDCSTLATPYPIFTWHMATDSREQLGHATSNLTNVNTGVQGYDCDAGIRSIYDTCQTTPYLDSITTQPTFNCNAATSKDGDVWPSIKYTGDQYFADSTLATTDNALDIQDNSIRPYEIVWILALQNIDTTVETTIVSTGVSRYDLGRNERDEGIRIYPQLDGTAYVGFRVPKESRWHPKNNPATTSAAEFCSSGGNPALEVPGSDIDKWWFSIEPNETFIMTVIWRDNEVVVHKNSGKVVYQESPYIALTDEEMNCPEKFARGGYLPYESFIHKESFPKTSFELLEMFSLMEEGHDRVLSADRETIEEYLSWKYNIAIPNRNFASCS